MSLHRSNTRFGSLRGTPESDNESNGKMSPRVSPGNGPSSKLRKRSLPSQDNEALLEKRPQSQEQAGTGFNGLHVSQVVHSKAHSVDNARTKHSLSWESLRRDFYLQLEDLVVIASQKDGRFVAVREFRGPHADRKVKMLQRVQDKNFLAFLDEFSFEGSRYVVFEHEIDYWENGKNIWEKFPVTLSQYALITPYPTEQQLATILTPILDGLKYLASKGLEHGALTCKNILVGTQGSIKIAGQECCRELGLNRGSTRDIKGVGYVTMELINKEAKYNGPIHVRDVGRWPLDSNAIQFLLTTESAYSIDELVKHPLFSYEMQKIDLKPNVYTAEFSVFRGYDLTM